MPGRKARKHILEILQDGLGQYRLRWKAQNGKILIVSSESYHRLADVEKVVEILKAEAAGVEVRYSCLKHFERS